MDTKSGMPYDPPPPYTATAPPPPLYSPTAHPSQPTLVMPQPPPAGMYPTQSTAPQEVPGPYQELVHQNLPYGHSYMPMGPLPSGPMPPVIPKVNPQYQPCQQYPQLQPQQYPQLQPAGPYPGAVPMLTSQPAAVTVVMRGTLGPYSTQVTCPKCQATVMTSTRSECGLLTFLAAGLCIVCGGVFGCCLIPFCMRSCQDIEHRCPNCKNYIGIYRRL